MKFNYYNVLLLSALFLLTRIREEYFQQIQPELAQRTKGIVLWCSNFTYICKKK